MAFLAEGVAKGERQSQYKIATRMLSEGLSPEAVAKLTGLSPDEINALTKADVWEFFQRELI